MNQDARSMINFCQGYCWWPLYLNMDGVEYLLSLSQPRRALPAPRLASLPRPPDPAMEDPAMDNPLDPRIPWAALSLRPRALPPLRETHIYFRGDPLL